jgi:ATP-dependent exoDNAse (exonuclease V) alpha subunit
MSSLGMMDLPHYLSATKGGANVRLFGVLGGEVVAPEPFCTMGLSSKHEAFAVVDLIGVQALTGPYFVRGKALVAVKRSLLDSAKSKQSGRIAVELSGTTVKLSNVKGGVTNFISMMKWVRGEHNSWQLMSIDATPFLQSDYPEFFGVVVNAYKNGWNFTFPVEAPSTYTDSCEGYDFVYLDAPKEATTSPAGWSDLAKASNTLPSHLSHPTQITPASALSGVGNEDLGRSTTSKLHDLLGNRAATHEEANRKGKFKVDNRDKLAPRTKNADLMEEYIKESDVKVAEIVKQLKDFSLENAREDDIQFCANALKKSWGAKIGASTGRMLFKEALERVLPEFDTRGITGETIISDNLNILGPAILDNWIELTKEQADNKFIEKINENKMMIYLRIIELLLGIRDKLGDCLFQCLNEGIDILALMKTNPYNLCFIDPRISVEDLDKLAMMYGIDLEDPEIKRVRNVSYMHNYLLDSSNRIIGDNTVVKYADLLRQVKAGYTFTARNVDILKAEGYIVQTDKLQSLKAFVRSELNLTHFILPRDGWKKAGFKQVLEGKESPSKMIKDYLDSGLGVFMKLNGSEYVSDFVFAKKEMFIYNRLRELCDYKPKKLDRAKIRLCIEAFEKNKGEELGIPDYKLEARQAEAVYLIGNRVACLTGPAGSGKTTTAEAMVYAIETVLNIDPEAVMFCAPTGKAANVLKEVVKRKTRTINSLFGIGGDGLSLKDPENIKKKEDIKALIVDESSMPNINLMYEMVLRIADGTYVFFLGDKEQLPPIGFGKPFATLLTFLPTVVLNVTKRASANSGITRNAELIIYKSDGVVEDLVDCDDFRIINEKNPEKVVEYILRIVNYHLGKGSSEGFRPVTPKDRDGNLRIAQDLKPEDIQIISPLNKYIWGTVSLNNLTHDAFNPRPFHEPAISYLRGPDDHLEFRLRDRVMHVRSNQSERTRLVKHGKSSFTQLKDNNDKPVMGINNGEVGKVVGFFGAKEIDFDLVDREEEKEGLQLEFRGTENVMFLGVEFNDVDIDTLEPIKFLILYRMELLKNNNQVIDVISSDLKYLDLANALTVHKLQGSQGKLVICIFLPVGGDFISRNMIYTGPTRGIVADYMIGDIYGSDSCVNKGRKIEQTERRMSNIDNI